MQGDQLVRLPWHTAVPRQGRRTADGASAAWAVGKGSGAALPPPAASASQGSRKLLEQGGGTDGLQQFVLSIHGSLPSGTSTCISDCFGIWALLPLC